ncbi:MAG: hypothetical protein HY290_28230 [Planctomycetia bacterium]|nr:hypothetical protein [Planctomycetia bacterium]
MKRSILASLTIALLMTTGSGVRAQDAKQPTYEGRLRRRQEEQTRRSTADQLRFERARERAHQRLAQESWNERMGRSTLRPYTHQQYWALGLGTGVR